MKLRGLYGKLSSKARFGHQLCHAAVNASMAYSQLNLNALAADCSCMRTVFSFNMSTGR